MSHKVIICRTHSQKTITRIEPAFIDLTIEDPLDVFPNEIVTKIFHVAMFDLAELTVFYDTTITRGYRARDVWKTIRLVSKKWNMVVMGCLTEDKLTRLWASCALIDENGDWLCEFTKISFVRKVHMIPCFSEMSNYEKAKVFIYNAIEQNINTAVEAATEYRESLTIAEDKFEKWSDLETEATKKKRKWEELKDDAQGRLDDLEEALARVPDGWEA